MDKGLSKPEASTKPICKSIIRGHLSHPEMGLGHFTLSKSKLVATLDLFVFNRKNKKIVNNRDRDSFPCKNR
jgi:hypothetical protein